MNAVVKKIIYMLPEIYSFVSVDGEEIKKAKGVNKSVVKSIRQKNC